MSHARGHLEHQEVLAALKMKRVTRQTGEEGRHTYSVYAASAPTCSATCPMMRLHRHTLA